MKCERCQRNPATKVVRGYKDGKSCELFVCDACAQTSAGPAEPAARTAGTLSLADILFSLGRPQDAPASAPAGRAAEGGAPAPARAPVLCPACGLPRETLRELRRFGCPACYDTFEDDVKTLLRELQYDDHHVGRKPGKTARSETLAALEADLAEAVRREDFSRAAVLRNLLARHRPPQDPSGNPADGEA